MLDKFSFPMEHSLKDQIICSGRKPSFLAAWEGDSQQGAGHDFSLIGSPLSTVSTRQSSKVPLTTGNGIFHTGKCLLQSQSRALPLHSRPLCGGTDCRDPKGLPTLTEMKTSHSPVSNFFPFFLALK